MTGELLGRPAEDARAIDLLRDDVLWPAAAAELLANLGFTLINSDRPASPAGSHLLVAFRAQPTLRHFDPETLTLFTPAGEDPGAILTFDRQQLARGPARRTVLWGHVHVIDRLRVENRFLTFGGEARMATPEPALTLVDIRSPGPIVRWGGHSQGSDSLAAEVGAFFGRLILEVDYRAGVEARLAALPPLALYAAFLAQACRRLSQVAQRTGGEPELRPWLRREADRVRAQAPNDWATGGQLLGDLRLAGSATGVG